MTKSTKQLLGLVGVLALLGGAYGGVVMINRYSEEKQAEESKAEKEANTFYLSQVEEPVAISYTNSYGTFSFTYYEDEEVWKYDADEHFPVTQDYLSTLSSDMKKFTAERKLEEVQDDLSVYGLDNPICSITAKGADDEEITVQIGSINSYSSDYYAKVAGADEIYTVSSDIVTDISYDLSSLQVKETYPTITSISVDNIELVKDGVTLSMQKEVTEEPSPKTEETTQAEAESEEETEETTQAEAESEEETEETEEETIEMVEVTRWVFTQDDKTDKLEEDDDIHLMIVDLVGLSFEDCADYYAEEDEKEAYGLTDEATVITIRYIVGEEENVFTLRIGNLNEDETSYYVSMDDSDEVNFISKESIDEVLEAFSNYFL